MRKGTATAIGLLAALSALMAGLSWALIGDALIGEDTTPLALRAWLFASAAIALAIFSFLVWGWPDIKRRWNDERDLLRESRAAWKQRRRSRHGAQG